MQLIYEGKDITNAVEINRADITDNAGGMADSLELWFTDPKGRWSQWKPKKNDMVQIKEKGFGTGVMYVDELEQRRGLFVIRALSIPQEAKTDRIKAWENVRFMEFAQELAGKYGFALQTFGIENHLYDRVDQFQKADFEHLAHRCLLEGYVLKLTNQKAVIYDERYMERLTPARTIYAEEMDGEFLFKSQSTGIFGSCQIVHGDLSVDFIPAVGPFGPTLKPSGIRISSIGEGNRFCRGLLRAQNKMEHTGWCNIALDTRLAAGNNVTISGVGMADGKYFCQQAVHRLVAKKTYLRLRKPLEGY